MQERLRADVHRSREEAETRLPGPERERLLKKARDVEAVLQVIEKWTCGSAR